MTRASALACPRRGLGKLVGAQAGLLLAGTSGQMEVGWTFCGAVSLGKKKAGARASSPSSPRVSGRTQGAGFPGGNGGPTTPRGWMQPQLGPGRIKGDDELRAAKEKGQLPETVDFGDDPAEKFYNENIGGVMIDRRPHDETIQHDSTGREMRGHGCEN
ncbi:unnamed protein product [Amoebophrya sp. A120]|nr:unnamed protein product [Amoebophrya sp. A120]|eukprot:GSA120T00021166001.1